MKISKVALFVFGIVLMCVPGFLTYEMKWAFVAFLTAGYVVFIFATVKAGGSKPKTAMTLLIASNVSFWLGYGLWFIRLKLFGPSPTTGIDAFAGPVALWLFLLPTFLLYEVAVFVRGLAISRERILAAVGLAAAAVQVLVTLRMAYALVQGV